MAREKLWRYSGVTRMFATGLLAATAIVAVAAVGFAAAAGGVDGRWWLFGAGGAIATAAIMFPLTSGWMILPSARLDEARPSDGPRLLEAGEGDWRRWLAITVVILAAGGMAVLLFLVGLLGGGGVAEGVVVGVMAAWGLSTLRDAGRIDDLERERARRYYTAGSRPTGAARNLIWLAERTGPPRRAMPLDEAL